MSGIPAGAGQLLGKRLGKYEILALLALGGTAEIYLARIGGAAGFEKYVVVKCLHDHLADDQEFVKMFLDEARLAAHLDHSNIVQTMELGEHNDRYYMVMEFLGGLSLAMVVRRAPERLSGGKLPVPLSINIMAQACAGLHYAHERVINGKHLNIVHRDISPQNLVVSFEGVVKVVDFGIAKAEMRETRTRSGTIKGKFAYMSPEQCVANNVDRRTDVFALGVIAHELVTGGRLFKRNSPYETYQAVIDCNVPPPSKLNVELDPALDPIIMKALAKDKEQRYPTAEAFGDALQGYLHHRGKASGPNEVARFFDTSFVQEIEEHGARMRELIEGRVEAADLNWGGDEAEKKRNETVDLSGRKSMHLDSGDIDILAANRSSASQLNDVISDLGGSDADEDDIPADRTRIETNPLDLIAEHEAKVAADAKPKPRTGPVPRQAPPRQAIPVSGAVPLPPPPSGKFADAANLATQVGDLEDLKPPVRAPQTAQRAAEQATRIAPLPVDPLKEPTRQAQAFSPHAAEKTRDASPAYASSQRPTQPPVKAQLRSGSISQVMDVVEPPRNRASNPTAPQAVAAHQQTVVAQPLPTLVPPPQERSVEVRPSLINGAQPLARPMPSGYPMLDAQLAAEVPARAQNQAQVQAALARESNALPNIAPQMPMQAPQFNQQTIDSGVFVNPPMQRPQVGPGFDPQRAADLMSPVGAGYPQHNWETAAAKPTRAVPPWMFAILFVVGFGIALALTIVIAKAAH